MASTAGPPVARKVVIYRNGDSFSPGKRLVVTHHRFPTFEAFLNEVTTAIQAPLAIRTLYTPQHGHVITDLSELQTDGEYVAAGFERFRKLPYIYPGGEKPGRKNIRSLFKRPVSNKTDQDRKQAELQVPLARNSSGLADENQDGSSNSHKTKLQVSWKENPSLILLHNSVSTEDAVGVEWELGPRVFRNGDLLSPPFSLYLSLTSHMDWGTVLRQLTGKAKLKGGAVSRLCTLEGVTVLGREDLVNGGYYVAVSDDEYKALPYLELLVPSPSLPGGFWCPPRLQPIAYRQKADSFRAPAAQTSRKESSISFARPMLARPHLRRRPLLQPGERGVYGAPHTRRTLAGAQEVEEDGTTLIEVPLDQRDAQMVEEACFLENAA